MTLHKARPGPNLPFEGEGRRVRCVKTTPNLTVVAAGIFLVLMLFVSFAPQMHAAQNGKGKVEYLIARTQINDPFFRHSVVFMLPATNSALIVGLIVNRPTRVTVGRLFPDSPELKGRRESAYFGGPVDVRTPSIAFHSLTAPENALRLYGDVYLTFDSDLIDKAYRGAHSDSEPRLFLGRAQWAPGQLRNEIRRGGWYRIQADGDLIFSTKPEDLWQKLHARAAPSKYIRYILPSGGGKPTAGKPAHM